MIIILNKKYQLTLIDCSWRVQKWHESVKIVVGPSKGKMSKEGFKLVEKFWPNPTQAARWVITQVLLEGEETCDMMAFIKKLEEIQDDFADRIKG